MKFVLEREKNPFWYDVTVNWRMLKVLDDDVSCFLWCNTEIRVGGEMIFWEEPFSRGLHYVQDLVEENRLTSVRVCWECFDLSWMQYNSLISAIPKRWLSDTKEQNLKRGNEFVSSAKVVYHKLNTDDFGLMNKLKKWEIELKIDIAYDTFQDVFKAIYKVGGSLAVVRSYALGCEPLVTGNLAMGLTIRSSHKQELSSVYQFIDVLYSLCIYEALQHLSLSSFFSCSPRALLLALSHTVLVQGYIY